MKGPLGGHETSPEPRGFPIWVVPEFLGRVNHHCLHPDQSIADYRVLVRKRQAARALAAHRLYLDTNHWTHLRDAALGRAREPMYRELLGLLEGLVDSGRLVVVFSDQLVDEVCHQADPVSRYATAALIDHLTAGITLIGFHDRKFIEIRRWVASLTGDHSPVPLDEVWTTVPHVYKLMDFELEHPDKTFVTAFLKAVEDLAHLYGMRGMIRTLEIDTSGVEGWRNHASELSLRKTTVWRDQGTFTEIFEEEALSYFDRVLDGASPEVMNALQTLPHAHGLEGPALITNTKKAFLACEQLGLKPDSLPTLRVLVGGNSRIRAEQSRKFKPGDGPDLFHAAGGVPYCNTFVTDRSLQHLLTTNPTDLAALYGSTVISSVTDAIDYLSRLAA
jgi:hypothetical protein